MTSLSRFLRILAVLDQRTANQVRSIIGCSRATFKRHLAAARGLGCDIAYDRETERYRVVNPGPFDVRKLRGLRWWPTR